MIAVTHVEARALKRCSDLAKRVYVSGLLRLVDLRDAHVTGPRQSMLNQLASLVGPVPALGRPLVYEELRAVLAELLNAGVIESRGDLRVFDVVLLPRTRWAA
ncbi:hypothetical protein [Jeongeupia chitinilytica]|uniref:Uncharacterized protein n=1 Tax=Jeongeupia chitinilytica TaxID=1041641 RepID=A0ABQ3GXS3_9NEIS|nr:hypothetical protein [Jeongeupia chitinilytica]GHD60322.1 hypothetical protein GCM10007350_13180 [Jeongeupia chitinilytica]